MSEMNNSNNNSKNKLTRQDIKKSTSRRITSSNNNPKTSESERRMKKNSTQNKNINYNSKKIENQKTKTSPGKSQNRKKNKKKKKRRGCLGFFAFIVVIFSIIAGMGIGVVVKIIKAAPDLSMISIEPTEYTTIFRDMNGVEVERYHSDENREYATLDQIPIYMQNAMVAIEDERFYSHFGIDIKGVLRASYVTIKNKITGQSGLEGASTITQQVIKNNVTQVQRNTVETKIQEQYLAVKYENMLAEQLGSKKAAKDYILEVYLNTIALGHGYNGVQAAAIGYFNKDSSELTLAECASIAAITNNPTMYSPRSNPEGNRSRQLRILDKMLEQNMITKEEYDLAVAEDIYSKISETTSATKQVEGTVIHSYFADSAFEQISKDLQEQYNISVQQANALLYTGGLQVNLTLDSNAQQILDDSFLDESLFPDVTYGIDTIYNVSIINDITEKQEHFEYKQFVKSREEGEAFIESKRAEIEAGLETDERILAETINFSLQPQAAMVIIDYKNGYVRAIAGSRDEKVVNRGFNRATDSTRQPGSVFKVLAAFAPGIDTGVLTPATVIDDVPFTKGEYSPSNWYSGYRGLSTIREAIRDSMNIVAVKAMDMVGVDTSYQYLLNFGFTTLEDDNHLATALGGLTNGVTQLEVTAAYGTIANGGVYLEPKFYTTVLDREGNILLDATNRQGTQVLKETSAFLLTDMMKDVVTSGTGTKARFTQSDMPVSGKTGTAQETRDLTFVGYTPYYVAGIWTGYDRYDSVVPNMQGILATESYHLTIWRTIMEKLHEGLPVTSFGAPSGIIQATICQESGLLATELCNHDPRGNRTRTEYFSSDNFPTEYCNVHASYTVCAETGLLADEDCPEELTKVIVGIVRPEPYTGTARIDDQQYEIRIPEGSCTLEYHQHYSMEDLLENEIIDTDMYFDEKFWEQFFENGNSGFNEDNSDDNESSTLPDIFGRPIESTPETIPETTTSEIINETTTEVATMGEPVFE